MADVALTWNPATGYGDIGMTGPSLTTGADADFGDLETAILISLFTDATADPSDLLPADMASDPRGWWADVYTVDPIGSKLWQVMNRPTNQDTLNFARDTIVKALQWLIDDGVATKVDCATRYGGKGALQAQIAITKPTGQIARFSYVWGPGSAPTPSQGFAFGVSSFGSGGF